MKKQIRIGNGQGFWGDQVDAPFNLLKQQPDIDYLTLDYLAEVSLSILAIQKEKDPNLGYAKDFLYVIQSLISIWNQGSSVKVITNAGGLNPKGCAEACAQILESSKCKKRIGVVAGDDVLDILKRDPKNHHYRNLDTGNSFETIAEKTVTANAYFGAEGVVSALQGGADIVIAGRVADPSLTAGACMAHFKWKKDDWQKIASAAVAGHLIECGTQVTGGISTHWLEVPNPALMGYPMIEMQDDGSFVVTKPKKTGGVVNLQTVKEQLLYELGDPANYRSPDVTVSFLEIQLDQVDDNRVKVEGVLGFPATDTYKVSATYRDGFMSEGTLALFGRNLREKGERCGEIILERLRQAGYEYERTQVELIGLTRFSHTLSSKGEQDVASDLPSIDRLDQNSTECMFRIAVADQNREAVERFGKEIAPLVTSGPQGITGYTGGRPKVHPIHAFWPCLIEKNLASLHVEFLR